MTTKFILQELVPAFGILNQMIRNGNLILPQNISYALGKNFSKVKKVTRSWESFRADQLKLHVRLENGMPRTVEIEKGVKEWDFISPESKSEFIKNMDAFQDGEILIENGWHKITEDWLKDVHNFPMEVFVAFEEAGILTSVHIAGKELNLVN